MIDINAVKNTIKALSDYEDSELNRKQTVIENAISFVEGLISNINQENMQRAVMLAAARANYLLALLNSNEAGISSFTAGDVKFTKQGSSLIDTAKAFYENTLSDNADIINDSSFDFRCV